MSKNICSDIMSISRLRMGTDGKGITTLIGFHGCPLECKYCINDYCHSREIVRADYKPEELIEVLSVDEPYYLMTDGGVTFGGGEPLMQADFIHEVCEKMSSKWKRNIETSLNVPWENVKMLLDDIDYWYVDIKDVNNKIYKSYTGHSNKVVLENLKKLVSKVGEKKVCVRIPSIPEYNTLEDQIQGVEYVRKNIGIEVSVDMFDYTRV